VRRNTNSKPIKKYSVAVGIRSRNTLVVKNSALRNKPILRILIKALIIVRVLKVNPNMIKKTANCSRNNPVNEGVFFL
jgi:hypothetical protein